MYARFFCLAAAATLAVACAGASPPPSVTPRIAPPPILPAPPWESRFSVADGYEPARAAPPPVMIRNATLMLATGKTLARGSILMANGKIAAVVEGDATPPPGVVVVDGAGKFVTPGIIDTHSHLGVYPMIAAAGHDDGNEMTDPTTPQAQSVDAFWPQDPGIERASAGGVTAIQVLPGSGNLIGGRAFTVKLRPALSARQMHVKGAPDGLKMACGENPKRYYGNQKRAPMSRMGNLALQRGAFLKAKKLARQWSEWKDAESLRLIKTEKKRASYEAKRDERAQREAWCKANEGQGSTCSAWRKQWSDDALEEPEPIPPQPPPERDPGAETLVAAMEGRVLVHVHCYRADDMMNMLALADEVGFKVRSFHHALEAYKIRGELAKRGVAASTWADWWGFKMEALDGIPENAALLEEAGARAIIHSDSEEGIQRLNQEAGKALASGRAAGLALGEEQAIRWITANPAWALGIDGRTGTLEIGKDADVVLWSRNPFSVYAVAEGVWVDGEIVHRRGAPHWSDFELGRDLVPMVGPTLAPGGAP